MSGCCERCRQVGPIKLNTTLKTGSYRDKNIRPRLLKPKRKAAGGKRQVHPWQMDGVLNEFQNQSHNRNVSHDVLHFPFFGLRRLGSDTSHIHYILNGHRKYNENRRIIRRPSSIAQWQSARPGREDGGSNPPAAPINKQIKN